MTGPRIDFHHHMMPPAYMSEVKDRVVAASTGIVSDIEWTPEISLARMDSSGIDAAVLSLATPGLWFGDPVQTRRLAQVCAEFGMETKERCPIVSPISRLCPCPAWRTA